MAKNIQSIERAFLIFEQIVALGGSGISELANKFNLNKSTVFGIVKTLENLGYVYKSEDTSNYIATFRIKSLASTEVNLQSIVSYVHPILLNDLGKYGETIHFVRAQKYSVVYLDKIESTKSIRIHTNVGSEMPLHCTSVGKAILAYRSPEEIDAYIQSTGLREYTYNTITNEKDLIKELSTIRENSYSIDNEEIVKGLYCIGVPIFDKEGTPQYAFSLSMPKYRVIDIDTGKMISDIKQSAKRIMEFF